MHDKLIFPILKFITSHFYYFILLLWIFPILCHVVADLALKKRLRDISPVDTRLSALGLSVFFSMGGFGAFMYLNCYFLSTPARHPIRHPTSIIIMIVSLIMFLFFLCMYINGRIKKGSALGAVIEVTLSALYSPALFTAWFVVYFLASEIYHVIYPLPW